MKFPYLLLSDARGKIHTHPSLRMAVWTGENFRLPHKQELIGLPQGSSLFYLKHRAPVGFNRETNGFETITHYRSKEAHAVSCFLIPAYLRLYHPAFSMIKKEILPLWAYAPVRYYGGRFFTTAQRIDPRRRQAPRYYNNKFVQQGSNSFKKRYPRNRLVKHLAHCALTYNCLAAKNLFLSRWEAPLPTAPACNAQCLGCLSYQKIHCVASHERIRFRPSVEEICEVAANHLKHAREAIVSFGQGCEGEPLLEASRICTALMRVRTETRRGTLHMNTNGSIPQAIEQLCRAGMDSFRISVNSTRKKLYEHYFRPRGYSFRDVVRSIHIAKRYGKFVSVNLLVFPGLTDAEAEIASLVRFIEQTKVDMVQLRNMNIDPYRYNFPMPSVGQKPMGILTLVTLLRDKFPQLKLGYFNIPKEQF